MILDVARATLTSVGEAQREEGPMTLAKAWFEASEAQMLVETLMQVTRAVCGPK